MALRVPRARPGRPSSKHCWRRAAGRPRHAGGPGRPPRPRVRELVPLPSGGAVIDTPVSATLPPAGPPTGSGQEWREARQLTIRAEQPDDVEVCVGSLRRRLRRGGGRSPTARVLAWLDLASWLWTGTPWSGPSASRGPGLDSPTKLVEVLVLSPMAVVLDRQRRVGSRLLDEAMSCWRPDEPGLPRGRPLRTPAGVRRRKDLGFTPSCGSPTRSGGHPPGYDQGAMSGALVTPDVFWRHDCVGLRPEV